MRILFAVTLLLGSLAHGQSVVAPEKLKKSSALYQLFSAHMKVQWKKHNMGMVKEANYSELLDPIPVFDLKVSCYSMRVIAVPFEDIKARAKNNKIATSKAWINSDGSRVVVYGVDFKNQEFNLLFDGVLADLNGAEDTKSECPDLLGMKLSNGTDYSLMNVRLKFSNELKQFQIK